MKVPVNSPSSRRMKVIHHCHFNISTSLLKSNGGLKIETGCRAESSQPSISGPQQQQQQPASQPAPADVQLSARTRWNLFTSTSVPTFSMRNESHLNMFKALSSSLRAPTVISASSIISLCLVSANGGEIFKEVKNVCASIESYGSATYRHKCRHLNDAE